MHVLKVYEEVEVWLHSFFPLH